MDKMNRYYQKPQTRKKTYGNCLPQILSGNGKQNSQSRTRITAYISTKMDRGDNYHTTLKVQPSANEVSASKQQNSVQKSAFWSNTNSDSVTVRTTRFKEFSAVNIPVVSQVEFSLSDSEYGSLKNERQNSTVGTCFIKRSHCDSTTDLCKTAKNSKGRPPDPKISTTVTNSLPNGCASSSGNTLPKTVQKQFIVPFKKRYVQSYLGIHSEPTAGSTNYVLNNEIISVSDETISERSSVQTEAANSDVLIDYESDQSHIVSTRKVELWKVDFDSAYNNDYVNFNEEQCFKLAAKISKEKQQYLSCVKKANTSTSDIKHTPQKKEAMQADRNSSHVVELYDGFRVRLSEEHLKTLSIHSRHTQEPGCSFQTVSCGSNNLNKSRNETSITHILPSSPESSLKPNHVSKKLMQAIQDAHRNVLVTSTNMNRLAGMKPSTYKNNISQPSTTPNYLRTLVITSESDSDGSFKSPRQNCVPKNSVNDVKINSQKNQQILVINDSNSEISKTSTNQLRRKRFAKTPLSPETAKRNDLYSYLQISSKPRLRSDGTPIEPNRRSVRVRNIEINKLRDRSLSKESQQKSVSNAVEEPDTTSVRVSANPTITASKQNIKKIFAKPKPTKRLKKSSQTRYKNIQNVRNQNISKRRSSHKLKVKKLKFASMIQTRRSLLSSITLRSKKSHFKSVMKRKRQLLIPLKRYNLAKPIENIEIVSLNHETKEIVNTKKDNLNEVGFTELDASKALNSFKILNEVNQELCDSLTKLNSRTSQSNATGLTEDMNAKIMKEKSLNRKSVSTDDHCRTTETTETKKPYPRIWNHINGPMTRHSHAAINKTLTRSSRTKIPKLNLDAVMQRMRRKHKTKSKLTSKSRSQSCSISNSLENTEKVAATDIKDSEITEKVCNLLDQVNTEVIKVQNNIMELSTQRQLDDYSSVCSKASELTFRGFGTPMPSDTTSDSDTESETISDKYLINYPKRRYSLPTYIGKELQEKYNGIIKECVQSNPGIENQVCTCTIPQLEQQTFSCPKCSSQERPLSCVNALSESTEVSTNSGALKCSANNDIFNTDEIKETASPVFIPLSPLPPRSFHQTFTKKSGTKLDFNPCLFGSEASCQMFDIIIQAWNSVQSSENGSSQVPALRPSIQTILNSKQEKQYLAPPAKRRVDQHAIDITECDGTVLDIQFVSNTLIIIQEYSISFWQQTPLGTMLGSQNMWLRLGKVQRMKLEQGCVNKRALSQSVMNYDNATAYVELWTKEHKSEKRERPISDVFATAYFYQHKKGSALDKKVLQLENIKGFAQDVQYVALRNSRSIIVSWRDQFASPPTSIVRRYTLAMDFQTVAHVAEIESIDHYITSLHNVLDCNEMVLGIGHQHVSVWHLPHGKLITTVTINSPSPANFSSGSAIEPFHEFNCVWAMCDRGFLFLIQKTDTLLQLIAINGLRKDWKQLQLYRVPAEYTELMGVSIEGGVLSACYKKGLVCWSLHSGSMLLQCSSGTCVSLFPSQARISFVDQQYNVGVKHVTAFLLED